MSTDAYNTILFTGTYRHGVDSKNRMTIPADWRSGEEGVLYVRLHTTGSHVVVMSPAELQRKIATINAEPDTTPAQKQQWIRVVSAGSQRCCVDKQGRMVLPPEFCQKAGLSGEVTVLGVVGEFQIWNTERWAAQQTAEETGNQALANRLGL